MSDASSSPAPKIRPDVVALLVDLEPCDLDLPARFHLDGRPMTEAECDLINEATGPEWEAAADYYRRFGEHAEDMAKAHERLAEIMRPYFDRLSSSATVDDVLPLLTETEREEVDRLHELVAPDGTIVMPSNATNRIPDPPHGTISAIELDGTPEDEGRPPLTPEQREHVKRTDRIEELDNALMAARGMIEQAAATIAMSLLAVLAEESWREFTTIEYASDDTDEKTLVTREFSRFRDFVNGLNGAGDTFGRHMIEFLLPYTPDSYFDEDGFTVDGLAAGVIYYMATRRKDADVCDDARKIYHRIRRNLAKG